MGWTDDSELLLGGNMCVPQFYQDAHQNKADTEDEWFILDHPKLTDATRTYRNVFNRL